MNIISFKDLPFGKYLVIIDVGKLSKIENDGSLTDCSNRLHFVYHELKLKGLDRDGDIFYNIHKEEN